MQAQTQKYNIGTLRPMNGSYDREHTLTERDVDTVNGMTALIEDTRTDEPATGDRMLFTNRYGDYYPSALVEKRSGGELVVCEQPFVPFVFQSPDGISLSVSGGGFVGIPVHEPEYVGKTQGDFKLWGHKGSCGNGAVTFRAKVNLWEYAEPNPLYGDFSTKLWRKIHFYKSQHPACDGYLYKDDNIYLPDEESFQQFLNTYCGTVFPGSMPNTYVVWCYREKFMGISRADWNSINEEAIFRQDGCTVREVKVARDYENRILRSYYVTAE